jgi:hypothetical protein
MQRVRRNSHCTVVTSNIFNARMITEAYFTLVVLKYQKNVIKFACNFSVFFVTTVYLAVTCISRANAAALSSVLKKVALSYGNMRFQVCPPNRNLSAD